MKKIKIFSNLYVLLYILFFLGFSIFLNTNSVQATYYWADITTNVSFGGGIAQNINDIAYGNGRWIAVGNGGNAVYSDDANVWQALNIGFGTTNINAIETDGTGIWLAVGDTGKVFASGNNGSSWINITYDPSARPNSINFDGKNAYSVEVGGTSNNIWMVVGEDGKAAMATSSGLTTWTDRTSVLGFYGAMISYDAYSVEYGVNGASSAVWLVGGESGKTAASLNNGTSWTDITSYVGFGSDNVNNIINAPNSSFIK